MAPAKILARLGSGGCGWSPADLEEGRFDGGGWSGGQRGARVGCRRLGLGRRCPAQASKDPPRGGQGLGDGSGRRQEKRELLNPSNP